MNKAFFHDNNPSRGRFRTRNGENTERQGEFPLATGNGACLPSLNAGKSSRETGLTTDTAPKLITEHVTTAFTVPDL